MIYTPREEALSIRRQIKISRRKIGAGVEVRPIISPRNRDRGQEASRGDGAWARVKKTKGRKKGVAVWGSNYDAEASQTRGDEGKSWRNGRCETGTPLSRKVLKKKSAGTAVVEIALVNFASVRAINVHHTSSVSVQRLLSPSFSSFLSSYAPRALVSSLFGPRSLSLLTFLFVKLCWSCLYIYFLKLFRCGVNCEKLVVDEC